MKIIVDRPTDSNIAEMQSWPIWQKEPSRFDWTYDVGETCYLLEGKVRVTAADGTSVSFGAGDRVTFPAGLSCVWEVEEPVRKHYRLG